MGSTNLVISQPFKMGVDKALLLLEKVVKGREEHVYKRVVYDRENNQKGCYYSARKENPEPSCIVGHVLAVWWPVLFELIAEEEHVYTDVRSISTLVKHVEYSWGVVDLFTPNALRVFVFAQSLQDERMPWGEVLRLTRNEVKSWGD